jgi:SPP1 family predicted phage head-tail adaptor
MASGKLHHRIKIQKRNRSLDMYGQQQDSWEDYLSVRANVRPVSGMEKLASMSVAATLTHTILVRYRKEFRFPLKVASMRVVFDERVLDIDSVRNLEERNRWAVLNCVEGSVDGN